MKLRIVGGPVQGASVIEVKHGEKFADIFKKINKTLAHDKLWEEFQLHPALLVDEKGARRVRPLPHVIEAEDTPKTLELPNDGTAFVMLRPLGSAPPAVVPDKESAITGESVSPARDPNSPSPAPGAGENPNPGASYHDRLTAIYTKYQPDKLHTVKGTLKKFAGKEEAVIRQLVAKYGPEPRIDDAMREAAAARSAVAAVTASRNTVVDADATPSRATNLDMSTAQDRTPVGSQSPAAITPAPSPREMANSAMTTPEPTPRERISASPNGTSLSDPNPNPGASYADRLTAIYTKYEPGKVHLVPGTLRKFAGREDAVVRSLVKKYGPEPVIGGDVQLPGQAGGEASEKDATSATAATPPPSNGSPTEAPATPPAQAVGDRSPSSLSPVTPTPTHLTPTPGARSYRDRLIAIYSTYHPEKLNTVEGNLRRFAGREEAMIQKLVQRYGPEPAPEQQPQETEAAKDDKPVVVEMVKQQERAEEDEVPADVSGKSEEELPVVTVTPMLSEPRQPLPEEASQEEAEEKQQAPEEPPVATAPDSPPTPEEVTIDLGGAREVAPITPTTPFTNMATLKDTSAAIEPPVVVVEAAKQPVRREEPAAVLKAAPVLPVVAVYNPPSTPPSAVVAASVTEPPSAVEAPKTVKSQIGRIGIACAALLAKQNNRMTQRRFFEKWLRFRDIQKAAALVRAGLWEQRVGSASYQLADDVKPAYVVGDLTAHMRDLRSGVAGAPRPLSDSMVLSLRAVLDALKKCLRSQAIEITSEEEKRMADKFLRQWESERDLCPVHDDEKLSHALQQAARFLAQIEDLMNVTRSQDSQLSKLKEMHERLQVRSSENKSMEAELKNLVGQLKDSKQRQQKLEAALEAAQSATTPRRTGTVTSAPRSLSRHAVVSPRRPSSSSAAGEPPRQTPTEIRQEAQIVRLQQELAKTRSLVNRSKSFEDKLKQQLEESEERQMRLRRVVAATTTTTTAAVEAAGLSARTPRNGSARSRTPRHVSPGSGVPQRSSFSQPHVSPRRGRSNGAVEKQADATDTALDRDEHLSPWPKSRYVPPVPEIDRGPCPNCLTPLTSISPDIVGPASERAAFCFSCRRSFTFAELEHRDGAGPSQGIAELWSSR